ncbi:MAG: reverse transcriptase/maturase family protein [Patescibacteria group bacterium]
MNQFTHSYNNIISVESLLGAWCEFRSGKSKRLDVQEFEYRLMNNILSLHRDLLNHTYHHSPYHQFTIVDPKPRIIHKATVRDRVVHRAIYRALYWHFHPRFINDSYSCQLGKGTHRALDCFRSLAYQASQNHTKTLWVLKCDIKKFFASIDHPTLLKLLYQVNAIAGTWDNNLFNLIKEVVTSFHSARPGVGLPLGNLTSQLFANVYLNELDQFIKHGLKQKFYLRYADDFVIMNQDQGMLMEILPKVGDFLTENLKLTLHPNKIFLKTVASGVDFLGWVHFPDHRVLRTSTKKRMMRNLQQGSASLESVTSYLGLLGWGNGWKLKTQLQLPIFSSL